MTLYVLMYHYPYEADEVRGIYSTRELAEKELKFREEEFPSEFNYYDIEEFILDESAI